MVIPDAGALVRAGTVSEMQLEMCGAIASLMRDTLAGMANDVITNEVSDIAVLCLEMTAGDITTTDVPRRFAEVALRIVQITPHRVYLHWLKVFERSFVCFSKVIPFATMSLLGVPECTPFPPVFASSTATLTPLTGIRLNA